MAHKKGAGSTDNGRDSHSKRLGVKLYGGQAALAGNIIIRQRGTKYNPGLGVGLGKDHTIFAKVDGIVEFARKRNDKMYVSVTPFSLIEEREAAVEAPVKEKAPKKAPKQEEAAAEEVAATPEAAVEEAPAVEETPAEEAKTEEEAPKKKATKKAKKEDSDEAAEEEE